LTTIPLRNSGTLTFSGVTTAYPDLNASGVYSSGAINLATGYNETNALYSWQQSYFDSQNYMAFDFEIDPGTTTLPHFPSGSGTGQNSCFINQVSFTCAISIAQFPGSTSGFTWIRYDSGINQITNPVLQSDVTANQTALALVDVLGGDYTPCLVTALSPTLLQLPLALAGGGNGYMWTVTFDGGATPTIYNALKLNNYGAPSLKGDKVAADGSHKSIFVSHIGVGAYSFFQAQWTPEPFTDGVSGIFGTTATQFDFGDATLDAITAARQWSGCDAGNCNEYVIYSYKADNTPDYILFIAGDLSYYDKYVIASDGGTLANTIVANMQAGLYVPSLIFNNTTLNLELACNGSPPITYATAPTTLLQCGQMARSEFKRFVIRVNCGEYCVNFLKGA
jgi:hypothetical protein